MGCTEVRLESNRFGIESRRILRELRTRSCHCKLSVGLVDIDAGSPSHALTVRWITRPCQNNSVRHQGWIVQLCVFQLANFGVAMPLLTIVCQG